MLVRLDVGLTICNPWVVGQQYLGRLDPFPTLPSRLLWPTMLVRLDVHLTSCRPQVVVQQYVGFLRRVSNIAIRKLMANNVGTFKRVSNIAM